MFRACGSDLSLSSLMPEPTPSITQFKHRAALPQEEGLIPIHDRVGRGGLAYVLANQVGHITHAGSIF